MLSREDRADTLAAMGTLRPRAGMPGLSDRQRQLLSLLDALGGDVGNLDFQKLLFLYCQELGSNSPYDFIPYRFGAFSFTSYADRRKLVERGLLASDDQEWRLTPEGRRVIGGTRDLLMGSFAQRVGQARGDALVADTYRRYPYYATRSEIADRVLRGDKDSIRRIAEARPGRRRSKLTTIGYEGMTLERFLNTLLQAGVSVLCDIRRNPLSRKYGFAKTTLAKGCESVGIRYEHLPELGVASEQRQGLTTQAHYDALFAEYRRKSLPKQTAALDKISTLIANGEVVTLMCYEHLPRQCHRHCVAEALERRIGSGTVALHLPG